MNYLCDICNKEVLGHHFKTKLCEVEIEICSECFAKSKFHILQVCPRCKSVDWVNCDNQNNGFAYTSLTCFDCKEL